MKILPFFIFILIGYGAISQDNIIKIDGKEITAKVISVELKVITYKRFDNVDGPTYSISKAEVFMIQYKNGTRDVFNEMKGSASNKDLVITPPNFKEDSLMIRSYIFVNGGIRAGVFPTKERNYWGTTNNIKVYESIGYTAGASLEMGNVFFLIPKKMPKKFGLGLNITWMNLGVVVSNSGISISPYTVSAGPQFSFLVATNALLDVFVKPGMSLAYINGYLRPTFQTEIGINIRYKSFMIGLSGGIMANWYANYLDPIQNRVSYNIPYNYSHIRIRVGVAIQKK